MAEQLTLNQWVRGSIPLGSIPIFDINVRSIRLTENNPVYQGLADFQNQGENGYYLPQ